MRLPILGLIALLAALAITGIASGEDAPPVAPPPAVAPVQTPLPKRHGCFKLYSRIQFRAYAWKVYQRKTIGKPALRKLSQIINCQHSNAAEHYAKRKRARLKAARLIRLDPWKARWAALPASDRNWAIGTGRCESGLNTQAVSSHGDHGAMQFKMETARAAGFVPSDPKLHSLWEQLVRAVWWMHKAGKGQWPVCGAR